MPALKFDKLAFLLLILFAPALSALGWDAPAFRPLPPNLDGSMMPYDFRECTPPPSFPDSLRPVAASYVARHGARYLSGPKKTYAVMHALVKARNSGTLSPRGEEFLKLMELVVSTNSGHWGDLSAVGVDEEVRLGERMAKAVPDLALPSARVNAVSSHVPRVVMTMYQFCHTIAQANNLVSTRTDESPALDPLLCCFVADSAYADYRKNGNWKVVYDRFVDSHISTEPARRLFSTSDLSDKKLRKLTIDMYEILKGNRAYGLPAPTTQWMSEQEYRACWQADNLRHYLRNSVTPLSDLAAKATAPLLRRIILDADSTIRRRADGLPYNTLNAYFGHCETLLPLLSLMGIPTMSISPSQPSSSSVSSYPKSSFDEYLEHLDNYWKIEELSPLGANLAIIFAEAPSGDYYVALQLNGRTIRPLRGYPDILPWSVLRDHWLSLLPDQ